MEIYNQIFQNPLIDATRSFYSQWACQRESELGCAQYVTEVCHNLKYLSCSCILHLEPLQPKSIVICLLAVQSYIDVYILSAHTITRLNDVQ